MSVYINNVPSIIGVPLSAIDINCANHVNDIELLIILLD